jgi:DNA-binding MarR family transcriptional regulator
MDDRAEAYRLLMADVYELAGASRRSSEQIATRAGQTVARWHVLSVLSEPLTVAAAARRLGQSRQSVHRVVGDLLTDGLVDASANPDHRSAPLVRATPAGADVLARLVDLADADRGARLAGLEVGTEQLRQARETLRAVLRALEAGPGGAATEA